MEQKRSQSNKLVIVLVISILVLSFMSILLYSQNILLASQVSSLTKEKEDLGSQISSLTKDKERLTDQAEQLSKANSDLQATVESQKKEISALNSTIQSFRFQEGSLNQQVANLSLQVQGLTLEKVTIQNRYNRVNVSYSQLEDFLLSYSTWSLNYTVKRVFTDQELLSLKDPLSSEILSDPSDLWMSYQDIYYWITKNVKYAYDEPFPVLPSLQDLENGQFKGQMVFDSIMAPNQTLQIMQGDCDDQAILAFSMVKSYNKYIYGKEYTQWLITITFDNDKGHMAMAIPSESQDNRTKLTIIDPAGSYLTNNRGSIASNDPLQELTKYSNHWTAQGGIKTITVYSVADGIAYILKSGNINEVSNFIDSY
jgi:cell division protein FtsL